MLEYEVSFSCFIFISTLCKRVNMLEIVLGSCFLVTWNLRRTQCTRNSFSLSTDGRRREICCSHSGVSENSSLLRSSAFAWGQYRLPGTAIKTQRSKETSVVYASQYGLTYQKRWIWENLKSNKSITFEGIKNNECKCDYLTIVLVIYPR
jgi:hypothetical protein